MLKPSFEMAPDVQKLVDHLAARQTVSYAEMSQITGREITGRDRYVLVSARRILENRGVIFAVQRGVGLTRANNGQVANLSTTHAISKIRRVTKRAKKREQHVNVQQLSADERLAFYVGRTVINAIGKTTLRSFRNQIRAEIEKRDGDIVSVSQLVTLPRLKKGEKK
jgi:predicted transcriptional regulator